MRSLGSDLSGRTRWAAYWRLTVAHRRLTCARVNPELPLVHLTDCLGHVGLNDRRSSRNTARPLDCPLLPSHP